VGLPPLRATLAALASAFAFSSVVFGAVPSSYALTGALMAALAVMTAAAVKWDRPVLSAAMLAVETLTAGTTSSNILGVGAMRWARTVRVLRDLVPGTVRAALLSAAVLLAVLLASTILGRVRGFDTVATPSGEFVARFTPTPAQMVERVARLPERLGRTFVATVPGEEANALGIKYESPIRFTFTYEHLAFGVAEAGLALVGLLVAGGAWVAYRAGGAWRVLGLGSLSSVAAFGGLYSVFGLNTYLYAEAWQPSAAILLAAWLGPVWTWAPRLRVALFAGLVAVMAIADARVVANMTSRLTQAVGAGDVLSSDTGR
jgi:hypothetical protein